MTLDEPRNPHHAAALERGDDPRRDTAQFRLASLLAEVDDVLTIHKYMLIAGRVLAFLPRINGWAETEAAPKGPGQLRQQQTATQSDEDFFVEQAHYHLRGYSEAMRILASMGSVYAKDFDPDERGADEDSKRIARERADEQAASNAPDLRAS